MEGVVNPGSDFLWRHFACEFDAHRTAWERRDGSPQGVPIHTGEEDLHSRSGSAHKFCEALRTVPRHALRLVDEQERSEATCLECASGFNEIVLSPFATRECTDPRDHILCW